MSIAEQELAEIEAQLVALEAPNEGLRDWSRLDLQPATQQEVRIALNRFNKRVDLLKGARTALQALVADGHPRMPVQDVAAAVYADLKENERTIEAALAQFSTPSTDAASLNLSAAPEEPKRA